MTVVRGFHSFQMFQSFKTLKTRTHYEGREGHEDRITERASNIKTIFFLRALRVLRGDTHFSFDCGVAALCLGGEYS